MTGLPRLSVRTCVLLLMLNGIFVVLLIKHLYVLGEIKSEVEFLGYDCKVLGITSTSSVLSLCNS